MKCPSCGHGETKVIDSRLTDNDTSIRRRRQCEGCDFRFTTFERMQSSNLVVEKKDGTTQPYDREKVEKGILIACGKRPVSIDKIREKVVELEEAWGKQKVVPTTQIGEDVAEMLKDVDEIGYIRFASVYKQFKDVDSFRSEFDQIFNKKS